MNPQKNKGDKAEREAAEILSDALNIEVKRNLSAGIPGDVGDLYGVPNTVVQVADWQNKSAACLVKPREVEKQRKNAGVDHAMTMVRFRGKNWRVVMTVEQFASLIK
tara:strand:+ start:1670 stop:1990 length:321 start_codon:yes stop_codon:yes gene_type:complete